MPRGIASFFFKRPALLKVDPETVPASGESLDRVVSFEHTADEPAVLKLDKVTMQFGGNTALENVDLEVRPGETHALIGPNGAGKTTLINVISGIYLPTGGDAYFMGRRTTGMAAHQLTQLGMVRTFQNLKIFPHLTVLENVMIGAHPTFKHGLLTTVLPLKSLKEEEREAMAAAREVMAFLGLTPYEHHIATELPYGTQKMIELARAIVARPKLLLLDEPAAGLHNEELDRFEEVIRKLQQRGMTILIIEHHLDLVLRLADRVTVLNFGKRIFAGSPEGARADEQVKEVYIGGSALTA
jgi:ABC-type branched-subunit amino acid transport system ATPase component